MANKVVDINKMIKSNVVLKMIGFSPAYLKFYVVKNRYGKHSDYFKVIERDGHTRAVDLDEFGIDEDKFLQILPEVNFEIDGFTYITTDICVTTGICLRQFDL